MNNESSKVLLAVCVLRNITWSCEKLSVMEFDALSKVLLSTPRVHGYSDFMHSVDSYFTETNQVNPAPCEEWITNNLSGIEIICDPFFTRCWIESFEHGV